jgi:hypothetical protein
MWSMWQLMVQLNAVHRLVAAHLLANPPTELNKEGDVYDLLQRTNEIKTLVLRLTATAAPAAAHAGVALPPDV